MQVLVDVVVDESVVKSVTLMKEKAFGAPKKIVLKKDDITACKIRKKDTVTVTLATFKKLKNIEFST